MFAITTAGRVLDALKGRPSRSSAAAIGIHYVLKGVPSALQIKGVDALAYMVCDWSVAILEEVLEDARHPYRVRRHALLRVRERLDRAIIRGYRGLSRRRCEELAGEAAQGLFTGGRGGRGRQAIEDLCGHLSEAVEEGFFGELADF